MTLYYYKAIDSQGNYHKGSVEAAAPREVREVIRKQNLIAVDYHPAAPTTRRRYRWSQKEKILFCTQLSHMLNAGIALYDALVILEEQARGEKLRG